jgi:cysteinyl-tRNA synthetase
MAYQSISREIIEEAASSDINSETIERQLVTPYQKALVASFSNEQIGMVKEALNQTEEMLVEDPIEREEIRLQNSVDRLRDIAMLIETGDFEGAKEALVNHELVTESILAEAENVENAEARKEVFNSILELRNEELALLQDINASSESLGDIDSQLVAMLNSAEKQAQEKVTETIAFIQPLIPELIKENKERKVVDARIEYFVEKISIYKTWQGQKNQIEHLLKEQGAIANNVAFLTELRGHLSSSAKDYLGVKILELKSKERYQTNKLMQYKIDRYTRERNMIEASN